jgi:anti-sigma factor RsiW
MTVDPDTNSHLSVEELAAYVDGRLDTRDLERAESHLASCAECRAELVEIRAIVAEGVAKQAPRPVLERYGRLAGVLTAAAAVIIVAAIAVGRMPRNAVDPERLRLDTRENRGAFALVSPSESTVPARGSVFRWHSASTASTYRLTITDSAGTPVWSQTTGDTSVVLPDSVVLRTGARYRWYVDALGADGRSATTGVRSFTTRP